MFACAGPETETNETLETMLDFSGLTLFLSSHLDFRPGQSRFPELSARQQHRHRALRLQGQAVADPRHLPAGGGEVRPGLQRIHHSRHEPLERTVTYEVLKPDIRGLRLLVEISPTFYEQLLHQFPFAKSYKPKL